MKPEGWNLALSKTLLLSKVLGKTNDQAQMQLSDD